MLFENRRSQRLRTLIWLGLNPLDFGLSRSVSARVGHVDDRERGISKKLEKLSVAKSLDKSNPSLLEVSCEGDSLGQINIDVCGTSLTIKFINAYSRYFVN